MAFVNYDSIGRIKLLESIAAVGILNSVLSINTEILSGNSQLVSQAIEIGAGVQLQLDDSSKLEIVGNANDSELAYLDLSVENGISQSVNVSNVGTIDWYVAERVADPPVSTAGIHSKSSGGFIIDKFRWTRGGNANPSGVTTFTTVTPATSNAGDDISSPALAGSTTGLFLGSVGNTSNNNIGFYFKIPVLLIKQILRIYGGVFNCDGLLTISFSNGRASKTYITRNSSVVGASREEIFKITFSGSPCDMIVSYVGTNSLAQNGPNIAFVLATLGQT